MNTEYQFTEYRVPPRATGIRNRTLKRDVDSTCDEWMEIWNEFIKQNFIPNQNIVTMDECNKRRNLHHATYCKYYGEENVYPTQQLINNEE